MGISREQVENSVGQQALSGAASPYKGGHTPGVHCQGQVRQGGQRYPPQFLTGLILQFPHAILHEASVTFLGFGLSPEQPAIGIILAESMGYLTTGGDAHNQVGYPGDEGVPPPAKRGSCPP